jgi:hypothetical protein
MEGKRVAIGTPGGLSPTAGVLAVGAWLYDRGIYRPQRTPWHIEITLANKHLSGSRRFAEAIDTRFQLVIEPDAWGYFFCHAGKVSRIRVTDLVRPELRDDHLLASATPPLRHIGGLVRQLETRCNMTLLRNEAEIATTLAGSEPIVRTWVSAL